MSSNSKYFGTDGIRGPANGKILNPVNIVRVGQAAGQVLRAKSPHARPTVVIGKDTRLSGYMIESALQAGFTSVGFTCLLVGPLPTPAVALLTRSLRADCGVMITASHNLYQDNGIKLFGPDGIKLGNGTVTAIEDLMDNPEKITHVSPDDIGKALRVEDAVGRYSEFIKTTVARDFNLNGLKLVVDCAHGAAYKIAPKIFWELGAQVVRMGAEPDGYNINAEVGATSPQALAAQVKKHKAHIGIALDGDADRLMLVDETGAVLDGDNMLAAMATHGQAQGTLQGGGVVATVMSNMGFEKYLNSLGLKLHRTPVGDHHVEAAMREGNFNLGGETSGHLIFRDYATTGDGTLAALQVLSYLRSQNKPASSLRKLFTPWPQHMENIRLPEGTDAARVLNSDAVQAAIKQADANLTGKGRTLVRKSGTEPLIRVMVEAETEAQMQAELASITAAVKAAV
ncbi:MAG TPA: phosphoglucosamine mutase [Alphaproteobacteria bacterium]|nr:phosphoglucosamine mutase [Alphaproteobacteria bacterium]